MINYARYLEFITSVPKIASLVIARAIITCKISDTARALRFDARRLAIDHENAAEDDKDGTIAELLGNQRDSSQRLNSLRSYRQASARFRHPPRGVADDHISITGVENSVPLGLGHARLDSHRKGVLEGQSLTCLPSLPRRRSQRRCDRYPRRSSVQRGCVYPRTRRRVSDAQTGRRRTESFGMRKGDID